jgi:hypothetical protein
VNDIECTYAGQGFWTHLHAHWAAFFDLLGWRWEHRPRCTKGVPDFVLLFERPILVRVVADAFSCREISKAFTPEFDGGRDHLMLGAVPTLFTQFDPERPAIGLLQDVEDANIGPCFEHAIWMTCDDCRRPSFFHGSGSWKCRVCGFYDGSHHSSPPDIARLWREAGSRVKIEPAHHAREAVTQELPAAITPDAPVTP